VPADALDNAAGTRRKLRPWPPPGGASDSDTTRSESLTRSPLPFLTPATASTLVTSPAGSSRSRIWKKLVIAASYLFCLYSDQPYLYCAGSKNGVRSCRSMTILYSPSASAKRSRPNSSSARRKCASPPRFEFGKSLLSCASVSIAASVLPPFWWARASWYSTRSLFGSPGRSASSCLYVLIDLSSVAALSSPPPLRSSVCTCKSAMRRCASALVLSSGFSASSCL
jgi:hypothetical protein